MPLECSRPEWSLAQGCPFGDDLTSRHAVARSSASGRKPAPAFESYARCGSIDERGQVKGMLARRRVVPGLALLIGLSAGLVWVTAGSSARRSVPTAGMSIPAVRGPLISSVKGSSAVSQPCLFTADFGVTCYGPFELGQAYDFPSHLTGKGQTIVIVDAYGSPTIEDDLAAFDSYFGIPDPTSVFGSPRRPGPVRPARATRPGGRSRRRSTSNTRTRWRPAHGSCSLCRVGRQQ